MTSKLSLYQGACAAIGSRKLVSLAEDRLSRRELDGVFDRGGIRTCLSMGQWKFALRTARLDYSPSVEPDFGYRRAFDKSPDWVRTAGVCEDELFNSPLTRYVDESAFLFSDLDTIYVRFVSDDALYGLDFAKWPESFTRYVEAWFGLQVHDRVVNNAAKKAEIKKDVKSLLVEAKAVDAMDSAASFLPAGSWSTSRRGNASRSDRGSRDRLIG